MPRHRTYDDYDEYDDGWDDAYGDDDDEGEYEGGRGHARVKAKPKAKKAQAKPTPTPAKKTAPQTPKKAHAQTAGSPPLPPCAPQPHLLCFGHVDAGKSTLVGRLLHALAAVSDADARKTARDAAQAGKASFAWAWLVDERPQERSRGVTEEVAMRVASDVVLMDAPGHRDFQPNVFAAMAMCDAGVFVVDASAKHAAEGEPDVDVFDAGGRHDAGTGALEYLALWAHFHARVWHGSGAAPSGADLAQDLARMRTDDGDGGTDASASGGAHLLVAVTKMDAVGWDRDRYDAVCACTRRRVNAVARLAAPGARIDVAFVPVAAAAESGSNVGGAADGALAPEARWVADAGVPTLVDALRRLANASASSRHDASAANAPWRLVVADAEAATAKEATVYGRLVAGQLPATSASGGAPSALGAASLGTAAAGARQVVIDKPRRLDDSAIAGADAGTGACALVAGDSVRLRLQPEKKGGGGKKAGGASDDVPLARAGCVLSAPHAPPSLATRFRARLLVFRTAKPLLPGAAGELLTHAVRCEARLVAFETWHANLADVAAAGKAPRSSPRVLRAGDDATVVVEVPAGAVVEAFAACRPLGCFAFGGTAALGVVADVLG